MFMLIIREELINLLVIFDQKLVVKNHGKILKNKWFIKFVENDIYKRMVFTLKVFLIKQFIIEK
jgi:hypothetical protein